MHRLIQTEQWYPNGMGSEVELETDDVLARLQAIDRYEFESFVADLFEIAGWDTEVTQEAKDGGIDVIAQQFGFVEKKALVQAKRPDPGNKVDYDDVTKYYRLKYEEEDTDLVVVATTAAFTGPAYEYARENNMKLMDGATLAGFVVAREAYDVLDTYAPPPEELDLEVDDFFDPDEEAREAFFGKRPVQFASSVFSDEVMLDGIEYVQQTELGGRQIFAMDQLRALTDGEDAPSPGKIFIDHPRLFDQNWYDIDVYPHVGATINENAELSVEAPENVDVMAVDHQDGVSVQLLLPAEREATRRNLSYLVDCHDFIADSELVEKPVHGGSVVCGSYSGMERRLERLRPHGFDAKTYHDLLVRAVETNSGLLGTVKRISEVAEGDELRETIIRLQELTQEKP